MPRVWRCSVWLFLLGLALSAPPARSAGVSEAGLFNSAAKAFRDGFYDQAEQDFAAFVFQFTNSAKVPEARLLQAQARLKQKNPAGAIQLAIRN